MDADGAVWYADGGNQHCVRVREGGQVLTLTQPGSVQRRARIALALRFTASPPIDGGSAAETMQGTDGPVGLALALLPGPHGRRSADRPDL